ncbi:ornithine cyclodeaminase family protein [Silvibacterium dinghuense]|uniref:Ornithine cyclodeaminase family protein n=1 Tax=Silvibacterium dinghuense TaxID=1560006 RepID=A0A4Q1SEA0_9BACT|nr:ornithine cyclodeaminase family protein [Silvibacterium dinghuense]RXS95447.1 ornithine cyclodeaminase family protein [Silvibacterium dinghuense]GGH13251.1 ornithine cyclodeaminase [Silvibacterium dinghuense]
MLVLSESQIRPHLRYETLLPALEAALVRLSTGQIRQPVRTLLPVAEHHGLMGLMPAVDGDLMGLKMVTVYEHNHHLPTHQAVIQLFRASTGEPLAVMNGRLITEMRTAAVSAIAARLFSRAVPGVVAILGSGVQARAHLEAIRQVREVREVRIWSRTLEHAVRFAAECGGRAMSAEEAVRGADIVFGVANLSEPLIRGAWLGAETFVAAVGAIGPAKRELDDEAMRAPVVVESREAALRESGDILSSGAPIYAELGEILAGTVARPARSRVVYKSLGVAAEDLAAARLVYEALA